MINNEYYKFENKATYNEDVTAKKISLKDIAEAAGVSTALVSFVLNGKTKEYRVGEETAQRILKIANEMNYQPNLAAKSLRSGKTKTIGLVVSDISNPFFLNWHAYWKMRQPNEDILYFLEVRMRIRIR